VLVAFFVVGFVLFSVCIAMNLFVAVIIEHFALADTMENIGKDGKVASVHTMLKKAYSALYVHHSVRKNKKPLPNMTKADPSRIAMRHSNMMFENAVERTTRR
ncbi:hypothetical protein T484DRAFT_1837942, partial [Baffinella frigidus]